MIDYDMVSKALRLLQDRGWSDLIDKKWKKEITSQIKEEYPNIDHDTLNHVLECVIW